MSVLQSSLDQGCPFKRELTAMCDLVSELIAEASAALFNDSLAQAEQAVSIKDEVDDSRHRCFKRLLEMKDLQTTHIICSSEAISDLNRMASLAMHIATITRRRHPDSAIPEDLKPAFEELCGQLMDMLTDVRALLLQPDSKSALEIIAKDDAVDSLSQKLFTKISYEEWPYTVQQAVDCSQITRFYERLADHCANVAALVIYVLSGLTPEEYVAQHQNSKFSEIKRFFRLS